MRVLMAVDDSSLSKNVTRAVVVGIRHENAEVLVLHVLQPVGPVPPPEMAQNYTTVSWAKGCGLFSNPKTR